MRQMYLNSMVSYNENTINSMLIYLNRKISIPATQELLCVDWNQNTDYIVTGGAGGILKVVKLEDTGKGARTLTGNQPLEGHSASVICASWNEVCQKLTTSDSSGLIIVWGLHNDSWFEEMINNRNLSTVVGIGWNCDGNKIAIAYADGQVIVGTLDGNRIWNKDLPVTLATCEWCPDGSSLIFGTTEGEVHIYDAVGNFVQKIHMIALDTVELETALNKDLRREKIVCIKYFHPVLKSKLRDDDTKRRPEMEDQQKNFKGPRALAFEQAPPNEGGNTYQQQRPRLMIAYAHGVLQLMRAENDPAPVILKFDNFTLTCARWSPNGAFIAVTGYQNDMPDGQQCHIRIVSSFGQNVATFKFDDARSLTGISWDPSGLYIVVSTHNNLFFGHIRPQYKWGFIKHTVIYSYEMYEKNQFCVNFYETKMEETYSKTVNKFIQLACYENYCVIVNRQDEEAGKYFAQLCNSIGTALDFKYTDVEPQCVAHNGVAAVIAGGESYFIWHFVLPKYNSIQAGIHVPGKEGVFVLENPGELMGRRRFGKNCDRICALAIADEWFLATCESGACYKISLSTGGIVQRFSVPAMVESMELNCNYSRLATLDDAGKLRIFDLNDQGAVALDSWAHQSVWSFKWDTEKDDLIAFTEKHRLVVQKGGVQEDPIVNNEGFICSFKGLMVKTVMVDRILQNPSNPQKRYVQDYEVKALRDVKLLLERMKISDATAFIERDPHPRLWELLAEVALNKSDFETAEHAYVKLQDYAGIQFIKRLVRIENVGIQNAEVLSFMGKFDKAEKAFIQNDRRDLAIAMYRKVYDWPNVLRLLTNEDDAAVRMEAVQHVGDYFYDRMKWRQAAEKYKECSNLEKQVESLIRGHMIGELEELSRRIPDGHVILEKIADVFARRGLCEQAVDCYIRCGQIKKALSCCMELNYWEKANHIAKTNHLDDVDAMLSKYAEGITGQSDEKSFSALQLYQRAGRNIDAARIAFDIAQDEQKQNATFVRLKKLYVLGGLLIEEQRGQKISEKRKGKVVDSAKQVLEKTLNDDANMSIEESRIVEKGWKGAEAFHFMMLAQKHFYNDRIEDALRTSLVLTEYEGLLDTETIYSMIALSAANVRQFSICSKAMMRLESLKTASEADRKMWADMSLDLFHQFPPVETQVNQIRCPSCDADNRDFTLMCQTCGVKFPICVATGRVLLGQTFWICLSCKHRAYEKEISQYNTCPLCHSTKSFETHKTPDNSS